eukprot:EG_transcript_2447
MLDDGPLLAPCCYHLPSNLDAGSIYQWLSTIDMHLICEIFTLSSKSVLYEMAQYCLQRPWHRLTVPSGGSGLEALMGFFAEALTCIDHNSLLTECRMLFMNHLEARLNCIRFQPALERLLPTAESQLSPIDTQLVVLPATTAKDSGDHCVVEEVDREKWVFRDGDGDTPRKGSHQGSPGNSTSGSSAAGPTRLRLASPRKLAFSATLFLWASMRLLARRIALLQEFPPDHAVFAPTRTQVSTLGDCFVTAHHRSKELLRQALALCGDERWAAALDLLTEALALTLDDGDCPFFLLQYRADCYFHLQQHQQVVEDCTSALRRNPHAFAALWLRARSYTVLEQREAAVADVLELVRLYPDSVQIRDFAATLNADVPVPPVRRDAEPHSYATRSVPGDHSHGSSPSGTLRSTDTPPDIGSPLSSDATSVGTVTFGSSEASLDLATLPAVPDPLVDEPPYLSAYNEQLQGGAELQYNICPGRELGRGAFARVYKAMHPVGGWFMAIKEVEAKYFEEAPDFLDALEVIPTMRHRNVVRCFALRRLPGFYHVVQEYCSGDTLRGLINGLGGLPLPLIRKTSTEVLLGLRYMHRIGLLHRDIKASNILLREDGVAKVADFGTCLRIANGEVARCDAVKGTVLWMAPETFRGQYSMASDIWSFGCTLIEMATAKDPWHEQQFREQLTAMVFIATRPDALPVVPPQFSRDDVGQHFFHCCIARDPAERCPADLLLRHPWLSGSDASALTSRYPSSRNASSPGSSEGKSASQLETSSSTTESSLVDTASSGIPLVADVCRVLPASA